MSGYATEAATWHQRVGDEYDDRTIIYTSRDDMTASRRWIVTHDEHGALVVTEDVTEEKA